jgi:hypothetical protein
MSGSPAARIAGAVASEVAAKKVCNPFLGRYSCCQLSAAAMIACIARCGTRYCGGT